MDLVTAIGAIIGVLLVVAISAVFKAVQWLLELDREVKGDEER